MATIRLARVIDPRVPIDLRSAPLRSPLMSTHILTPGTHKHPLLWHTNARYCLTHDPSNELMLIIAHREIPHIADAASHYLGIMFTSGRSSGDRDVKFLSDLHKLTN